MGRKEGDKLFSVQTDHVLYLSGGARGTSCQISARVFSLETCGETAGAPAVISDLGRWLSNCLILSIVVVLSQKSGVVGKMREAGQSDDMQSCGIKWPAR